MSMMLTHNTDVQMSLNEMNKNVTLLGKSLSKISTGQKITEAKDGGADYAISEKMREQLRSLNQDTQNIQNGSTIIKIAERGIDQIIQEIRSLKELSINAANDSNTDEDRRVLQKEFDSRKDTINDIVLGTQYNSKILLDGRWEEPQTNVDLIFVVDTTSSMTSYISSTANNLTSFANYLTGRGYSLNLGLVQYDDVEVAKTDPSHVGVKTIKFGDEEFTSNATTFVNGLRNLSRASGGDLPESRLEGVLTALNYTFRNNAKKGIIVITDDVVHTKDGDGKSEYNLTDVLSALRKADVKLSAVVNTSKQADWSVLADGTEGTLYNINGDYGAQLTKEAESYGIIRYNPLHIQHGTQSNQRINCYINGMRTSDLKLDDIEITTRDKAIDAISAVEGALERALNAATNMGAYLQRLDKIYTNIVTSAENVQAAESTIRDADMAKEMVNYARYRILSRSSQTMLSQANHNEQSVLGLLR